MSTPKGTVRTETLRKLREGYRKTWNREWPEDDDYLAQLWNEERAVYSNANGNLRVPWAKLYEETQTRMRENHEFTPDP